MHDLTSALQTIDQLYIGKQRRRPKRLRADKGYDSKKFRQELRKRGIRPAISHREFLHRKGPKSQWDDAAEIRYAPSRWKVEREFAHIDQNRRLDFLYEETRETYEAFLTIAFIRIYLRMLRKSRK